MDSQLLTLSKIFTERLFRIPDYQRGYAWTEKQLLDFWNDIMQLETGRNHYTGVLTLEDVPKSVFAQWEDDSWIIESKSFQPFFVVDGQQRLTTAIVLVQVILDNMQPDQSLNFTRREDIQRKFIFDSKDDGISRSYIFGYDKDNPSYEFLKTKVFCEKSSSSTTQETIYTQNLANAKLFFASQLDGFSHKQLQELYSKVTQHLLFNIFTITEDVDVCVAFETMNNRGKPLSRLELLKNRLIYLSLKFKADEFEKAKLRRAINDCWKAIYHNLGRNKDNPLDDDRFLATHYVIYFSEELLAEASEFRSARQLRRIFQGAYATDLLENRFVTQNVVALKKTPTTLDLSYVYQYVNSLQDSVETWYKLFNPLSADLLSSIQIWLDKLNRIGFEPIEALVLVFMQRVEKDAIKTQFLQAVERLLFVLLFIHSSREFYPNFFSPAKHHSLLRAAIELDKGKVTAEHTVRTIVDMANRIVNDESFLPSLISNFKVGGYYDWPGIRYFLFEYNLDLQSRSRTQREKIHWPEFVESRADFMTVEHIYPAYAKHEYWASRFRAFSPKHRSLLRNSLGNLLPLSRGKNSSLSNKPFPDKVSGTKDSVVGYSFGSYAENEVAQATEWTAHEISNRGIKMLLFLEKRWSIPLGNEETKKSLLGLDFL